MWRERQGKWSWLALRLTPFVEAERLTEKCRRLQRWYAWACAIGLASFAVMLLAPFLT